METKERIEWMHTIVIDMFVNHFNPKYETQFSQCLQVVGMNDVRTKEVVQKSAQLIHIVTAKIKLSRLLTTTTKRNFHHLQEKRRLEAEELVVQLPFVVANAQDERTGTARQSAMVSEVGGRQIG